VSPRAVIGPAAGVLLGAGYGLFTRWIIDQRPQGGTNETVTYIFTGVSLAFLFCVPFGLGVLTAAFTPSGLRYPWLYWLLMPWVSVIVMMAGAMALAWEGIICVVMASPILLSMALLGGLCVGVVVKLYETKRPPTGAVATFLVLPFAVGPIENRLPPPTDIRTVTTIMEIDADPATVWSQVVRVPLIRPEEQTVGFFQRIGIPQPLEATLSGEGVGALREARFAGGVRFVERVTEWEPERRLAFTIDVDEASIPADVLDAHVRVGGPHFDVTYGRFVLEPLGRGTRLELMSRHRVSTRFNFYTGFWTEAVMRDIQANTCSVIARRAVRDRGTDATDGALRSRTDLGS